MRPRAPARVRRVASAIAEARASFVATAAALLAFLRRPSLSHAPFADRRARITAAGWLLLLSLMISGGLALFTLPLVSADGAGASDQLRRTLSQPLPSILVTVILLGPLIEEVFFRGWLSGRWRAAAATALFAAAIFGGAYLLGRIAVLPAIAREAGLALCGILALSVMAPVDRGAAIPGYARVFPIAFWGQGVLFGALHYQNLANGSVVLSVLATMPLVACGWLWGYARIALGLPTAIALHMAYNVPALTGTILWSVNRAG